MTRLSLLAAFILLCGPVLAADQNGRLIRSTDMYTGPGKYPILMRMTRGDQVKVLGCNTLQAWCEVGAGNVHGWVSSGSIELISKAKKKK